MKIGDKFKTPEGETVVVVSTPASPSSKIVRVGTEPGADPYREEFIHVDELKPVRKQTVKNAAKDADKKQQTVATPPKPEL